MNIANPSAVSSIAAEICEEHGTWIDPDITLLTNSRKPPPDLPLGIFGDWAPRIQDMANASSAPLDYSAFALLAHAAALTGNAIRVRPQPSSAYGWTEPLALWVAIVGPPSSGKTPALKPFADVVTALEAELRECSKPELKTYTEALTYAQAAHANWKREVEKAAKAGESPPPMPSEAETPEPVSAPRIRVIDTTIEKLAQILASSPKGVLQYRDELAAWFDSMVRYSASSDRAQWLELYNGGSLQIDRVKHDQPIIVSSALASILGGIQPDRLSTILRSPDDGLIARFLFIWPETRPLERGQYNDFRNEIEALFKKLNGLNADDPLTLPFEGDAEDRFFEFRQANRKLIEEHEGVLAGWIGKAPGVVARLSGILELLDAAEKSTANQPTYIRAETAEKAMRLWTDYLLPMAVRTLQNATEPECLEHARAILKRAKKQRLSMVSNRDVYRTWNIKGMGKNADKCEAAMKELQEGGWVRPGPEAYRTGGRSRKEWCINPKLMELE